LVWCGFAERQSGASVRPQLKSSLDEVVVSAVDDPGSETNADQLAGRSTPERVKFDEGPASPSPSAIFVADMTSSGGADNFSWHSGS